MATKSNKENNFDSTLFYNFIGAQIYLKNQEAHKRRHPANSFAIALAAESHNKNIGRYKIIRNNSLQILFPLRNALCKTINNNNLPLKTFFQHHQKL